MSDEVQYTTTHDVYKHKDLFFATGALNVCSLSGCGFSKNNPPFLYSSGLTN